MIASSRYETTSVPIRMKNIAQRVRAFASSSDIGFPFFQHVFALAGFAPAPSFWRYKSIVGSVRVASRAVRFGLLSSAIGSTTKRESGGKHTSLRRNNFLVAETLRCPLHYRIGFNAADVRQVSGSMPLAFNHHPPRNALIAHLLSSRSPAAVARLVVSVIVDAVERVAFRFRTYVA